jgi:hypothetical protein
MKSTILLTIALFLLSAPTPDSNAISEISAGFLVSSHVAGLMASELDPKAPIEIDETAQRVVQHENGRVQHFD